MANWCEGVLKLAGPKENHMRFFKEGLQGYKYVAGSDERPEIPTEEWFYEGFDRPTIYFNPDTFIYIKDTKRAFIVDTYSGIYDLVMSGGTEDEGICVSVLPFKQAWDVRFNEFADIAKKYELNIKIFAVERGMGFWREGTIIHDGTVYMSGQESFTSYANFLWRCPYPMLGG